MGMGQDKKLQTSKVPAHFDCVVFSGDGYRGQRDQGLPEQLWGPGERPVRDDQ